MRPPEMIRALALVVLVAAPIAYATPVPCGSPGTEDLTKPSTCLQRCENYVGECTVPADPGPYEDIGWGCTVGLDTSGPYLITDFEGDPTFNFRYTDVPGELQYVKCPLYVEPSPPQAGLGVDTPTVSDPNPETGAAFTLSATVINTGGETSAATTLRYYRSSSPTFSTTDTAVGTDAVGALAANATSAESISLTAPATAGTYYYYACVDAVADESNATNNCSSSVRVDVGASAPGADLEVGAPTASDANPETGAVFTLSATVTNTGDEISAATTLRYYRSSDATVSTTDTAVGTDAVGALAANATSAESISLTAPAAAGTYYYGACVDAVADESDTGDNCSTSVRVDVGELPGNRSDADAAERADRFDGISRPNESGNFCWSPGPSFDKTAQISLGVGEDADYDLCLWSMASFGPDMTDPYDPLVDCSDAVGVLGSSDFLLGASALADTDESLAVPGGLDGTAVCVIRHRGRGADIDLIVADEDAVDGRNVLPAFPAEAPDCEPHTGVAKALSGYVKNMPDRAPYLRPWDSANSVYGDLQHYRTFVYGTRVNSDGETVDRTVGIYIGSCMWDAYGDFLNDGQHCDIEYDRLRQVTAVSDCAARD